MDKFPFDTELIDHFPEAVGIADLDGNIYYVNEKFVRLFGYTIDQIPNMEKWAELAYPDEGYREEVLNTWQDAIQETIKSNNAQPGKTFSVLCADSSKKEVEISFSLKGNLMLTFFKDISELSRTEKEVAEEREFTQNLIDNLPGIFYMFESINGQLHLKKWNKNLAKVTGYSAEELQDKHILEFSLENEKDQARKAVEEVFHDGYSENPLTIKTKSGKGIPHLCAAYIFEDHGSTFLLGLGVDITKQIESEINLSTIFEAFPDTILISDYQGTILFVNDALKKQTGYTKEFLNENRESIKLHPEEDSRMLRQKIKDLLSSESKSTGIIENRFIDKKGNIQWYSGVIAKTIYNNIPALITISRNITQRKYSEQALVESENRMSTVFDSAPVIMMLINEKREILQINKKGIQGLSIANNPNSLPFGDAYKCINSFESPEGCGSGIKCSDCTIRKTIQDTFNTGKEHIKVSATVHSMDKDYHILLSSSLLKIESPKEVLLTVDDVTEQKKIEEALKVSREKAVESDKLKSAFLQNMSHEIRTPLNGILGFSGLLNNDELSSEERAYYIEVINQSSNQLLGIVDDILSISRLETGQIEVIDEEVNINSLLQELFGKYNPKASERNLILSHNKELDDKQCIIYSDSDKIRQILDNLLSNALKFTHKGHVLFGYTFKTDVLEFYVEDSGIGIEREFHDKIFERFQQVDFDSTRVYGGTGLGLTIAKGNTELLGGKIWMESTPGTGSKFFFTLPYKPVHAELKPQLITEDKVKSLDEPTILVAEDEEINFLFIAEALKDLDHKLIHAYNGIEAVEHCKKNKNIVLVLMDIKMPKMDGYSALEQIKEDRPELPVIAQTAYAMVSDKEKALSSGFMDYLSKPIKKVELLTTINKYLD